MQSVTNNTQLIPRTIPSEQQPVTSNHSKLTNILLTSTAFISDRSIYKFTNIISSKKFVSFCQQQDQQQALQKVTNIMSKHSYFVCKKWIFSYVTIDGINSNKTPIVFAIDNGNISLACQIISLMEKKYQQHDQGQPPAWIKDCLTNENYQQYFLARQISNAITQINIQYVVEFQGLLPSFLEDNTKAYHAVENAIKQKDEQALKLLLNNIQSKEEILSCIMLYDYTLTSKAIASNNINIIKQVLEFVIYFYKPKINFRYMISMIKNNNYVIMKILINIMKANGISIDVFNKPKLLFIHFNIESITQSLLDYSLVYNYNNATLAIITSEIQLNNNKIIYPRRMLTRNYSLPSLFWVLCNPDNKQLTTEKFNMLDILHALGLRCSIEDILESFNPMKIDLSLPEKEIIKQKICNPPSLVRLATVSYVKNTLTKIGADFNLETFKNNLAEYFPKNALKEINTIEDLFSIYC